MHRLRTSATVLALLLLVPGARAGLYYSGETIAELPSQWRGFLLDQRTLRNIALKPAAGAQPGPVRVKYEEAAANLEKFARERKLTADELADLGALYVRLGDAARALEVLRNAQREHPNTFRIVANLGTAWQLQGDLEQAATCLEEAARLAPGKFEKAEHLQLKLVRQRQRRDSDPQALDDLFGVRYLADGDKYEPGKMLETERKKLPADAVANLQLVALWLPADGRLLWQLAEIANAFGDMRTAAAIMDGCVTEFAMRSPELRQHRQLVRAAADEITKEVAPGGDDAKTVHENHVGGVKPRSSRPLVNKLDAVALPLISDTGINPLPWAVLAETSLDRKYRPTFAKYLRELDGKQIELTGFMQPLGEDLESASFMFIEYPVGCWYCEMPEVTGIVLVDLARGKTKTYTRSLLKVTGKLSLNDSDPENFLYTIRSAKVTEAD
jgi:tetratricopeptide (TPR) repeat protein